MALLPSLKNHKECLQCVYYWGCKNPVKKQNTGCESFASAQDKEVHTVLDHKAQSKAALVEGKEVEENNTVKSLSNAFTKLLSEDAPEENFDSYFNPDAVGLKLPEGDFPLAKNLKEFVFSKKFLNLGATGLYARQLGIGLNLFMEYCPKCSDVSYIQKNFEVADKIPEIFNKVTLFEHGQCPKCKTRKDELLDNQNYWEHYELAALCGQRSGKSLMAAIFASYVLHRFLKLPNIASAYDIAKPTILLGTFVAIDKSQIQDSTWGYLTNIIKDSPWFIEYCNMLKSEGRKLGRKLVDVDKVETIEFFHKNLKLNMAAPKPAALRGRTGFIGVIDEIGFLKVKDGEGRVITAEEVYAALNNRMATLTTAYENRRSLISNLPAPLFMNISSPAHVKDKIYTLVKGISAQNLEEASKPGGDKRLLRRYAVHYATWEVNPMFSRDSAYIASKFKAEPKEAERDFGAKPPLSENSFIDNVQELVRSSNKSRVNLATVEYSFTDSKAKYQLLFKEGALISNTINRVLALDLGYNNNSTALVIGSFDEAQDKTIIEALIEIIPTKESEIRFTDLLNQIIKPLIERLSIKLVISDTWQSIGLMQDIEQTTEASTIKYSLKYGDFLFYKSDLMAQRIEYPQIEDLSLITPKPVEDYPFAYYNKPVEHFVYQCLTVVDERDVTIKKGDKTTDDLFRASVLLHYALNNLALRRQLSDVKQSLLPQGPVVHVQSVRNGATGNSNTSTKFSGSSVVVV